MYYWDRLPTQASERVAMGLAGQSSAVGPLLVRPFAKKLTPSLSTAVPCSWPMISQRHCRSGGETAQGHAERTDSRGSGGTAHLPWFASAYAPPSGHLPNSRPCLPREAGRWATRPKTPVRWRMQAWAGRPAKGSLWRGSARRRTAACHDQEQARKRRRPGRTRTPGSVAGPSSSARSGRERPARAPIGFEAGRPGWRR
jgi:hypothetical protein